MYKIVYDHGSIFHEVTNNVEKKVKELKSQGWSEQGGVSVSVVKNGISSFYTVAQAMVKSE